MTDSAMVDEIRQIYAEGGLLPFIGAGLSMSISWTDPNGMPKRGPSWRELVDQAAEQLGFSDPELLRIRGEDLQILEYYRDKNEDRLTKLTNWMVREFDAPDQVLRDSELIRALASLKLCRKFYTTNFDAYLERGLRLAGRTVSTVATEHQIRALLAAQTHDPNVCEVVKFHGDLESPEQMVVTESDYRNRLALETLMDDRLKSDLLGRAVLFVGYSFRDWNVSYLFHVIEKLHGRFPGSVTGRRAFVTVADPSDFEIRLFARRQIGVVPVSSHDMSAEISDIVRSISEE